MQKPALEARAEPILSGLRPLTLRPNRAGHLNFTHLIVMERGSGILSGTPELALQSGTVLVLPPDPARVFACQAGSRGWLIGAAPDAMADAIGQKSDSQHLRRIVDRIGVITSKAGLQEMAALSASFHAELTSPLRGADMAALAHLRLILIAFWRQSTDDTTDLRGKSSEARFVEDFRRRVELGFREQHPVSAYATDLGLTYDRLHDICRRSLQRTPLQLIHQRMLREAALRLERSGETIEQIAVSLGFADPTRFSHFFRRHTGLSPRMFRRNAAINADTLNQASFADWP